MKEPKMNLFEKIAFKVIQWGATIFIIGLLAAGFKWLIGIIF
jgi:hypothetical protein